MNWRGGPISEGNRKEGTLALRSEPEEVGQEGGAKVLRKGNGAGVISRLPFPASHPLAIEGPIAPMSESALNSLVDRTYKEIQELKESAKSLDELEAGMGAILYNLASIEDINYSITVNYSLVVDKLLMKHWTQREADGSVSYDKHMQSHVDAIDTLFEGVIKELKTRFRGNRKIRVLDVSCGTGEVLKRFLDRVPRETLHRIQIVANDASGAALDICKRNLKEYEGKVKRIKYTNHDINDELPEGKYHIVIESQSMEFISDDRIIKARRLGKTIRQDEEGYDKDAKRRLTSALFDRLVPERGVMLMIQEDPMMLTKPARDPDSVITKVLFDEIFRPIRKEELINDVLKAIPGAKFVCDLQAPIDRRHDMYLIASSRIRKKDARMGYHPSRSPAPQHQGERKSRDFDVHERNIVQAMETIYPILAERLRKIDGDIETLKPISGTRLVIDRKKWEEEASKPHFWRRNGTNDLVIVSGIIHSIGIEAYQRLLDNLNSSGKAKEGTVMLFIDEWPAPAGLVDNHVGNSDARKYVYNRTDQAFLAAYRSGNRIGYLHVKRDPLKLYSERTESANDDSGGSGEKEEKESGEVISRQSVKIEG